MTHILILTTTQVGTATCFNRVYYCHTDTRHTCIDVKYTSNTETIVLEKNRNDNIECWPRALKYCLSSSSLYYIHTNTN